MLLGATCDLLLCPVLGRNCPWILAVPYRGHFEAEADQVGKEKRATRTAWSATVPTRLYSEEPAPATILERLVTSTRLGPIARPPGSRAASEHPAPGPAASTVKQRSGDGIGHWSLWRMTDADYARAGTNTEGVSMALEAGKRVVAESESTDRRPRSGVVEEVLRGDTSPRYRIRRDDGHESIYTPASGALRAERRPKRQRQTSPPKRKPS